MDTLVADVLTSSPRTYDAYGLCGYSTLSEFLPHGDLFLKALPNDTDDDGQQQNKDAGVTSNESDNNPEVWIDGNDLTPDEKLDYALQLAESIQDLHGLGIVHNDLKMDQFLFTSPNRATVKLNDFNKARILMWNDQKSEYCYYEEDTRRKWRAPEEYHQDKMNEKVDVFNYGNMLYILLTGKWYADDDRNEKGRYGGRFYLPDGHYEDDDREALLVDLIKRCRAPNPKARPSMVEVIDEIRHHQQINKSA
mmetsp:Transcript_35336/g.85516  ORF Transcript_35336/g.85516 Transcript_35336/m.85516 type:complete len:251 (+) Transcript_35336:139-891(+)